MLQGRRRRVVVQRRVRVPHARVQLAQPRRVVEAPVAHAARGWTELPILLEETAAAPRRIVAAAAPAAATTAAPAAAAPLKPAAALAAARGSSARGLSEAVGGLLGDFGEPIGLCLRLPCESEGLGLGVPSHGEAAVRERRERRHARHRVRCRRRVPPSLVMMASGGLRGGLQSGRGGLVGGGRRGGGLVCGGGRGLPCRHLGGLGGLQCRILVQQLPHALTEPPKLVDEPGEPWWVGRGRSRGAAAAAAAPRSGERRGGALWRGSWRRQGRGELHRACSCCSCCSCASAAVSEQLGHAGGGAACRSGEVVAAIAAAAAACLGGDRSGAQHADQPARHEPELALRPRAEHLGAAKV